LIFLKNFFETVRKDLYHIQLIVAGGIILLIADFLIILLANYEKYPSSDLHRIFVLVDRQQGKSPADRLLPGWGVWHSNYTFGFSWKVCRNEWSNPRSVDKFWKPRSV